MLGTAALRPDDRAPTEPAVAAGANPWSWGPGAGRPRPPLRVRGVSARLALWLAVGAGGVATGGPAPSEPAPPDATRQPPDYLFSEGFSPTQGENQWYYREWDGASYRDMRWDPEARRWRGSSPLCQVWQAAAHPGSAEAVIAWRAPRAGMIHIQGMIERPLVAGDGTRARIVKNGAKIWPTADWQRLDPGFIVQHSVIATVEPGDWIAFHVDRSGDADFDDTRWDPAITYDRRPGFLLDESRRVMDASDLRRVGIRAMDASLCIPRREPDGRLVWSHSIGVPSEARGARHQQFLGTLDEPAGRPLFEKDERQFFVANPSGADGRWWLNNVYRHPDGRLIGFCHVENAGNGRKFRIGLATSIDEGKSWSYLGHVIRQQGDPDDLNIMGVPYLVKDGHFYIYFADAAGACVARAPVAEVMAAAARGETSPWRKSFESAFGEPGWGGRATGLGVATRFVHSDAAFSVTRGRYILTGYDHGPGRGIWISFSDDCVNWTRGDWLQHGHDGNTSLSPYVTIVADDGSDNARVGDSFYVYFAFNASWDTTTNLGLQSVYRQKVTLVGP